MPNVRGFQAQEVTLVLHGGGSYTIQVDRLEVAGRSGKPLTVDERLRAFRTTARGLEDVKVDRLVDIVMNIEEHRVSEISETLLPRSA
jgi:hypothetical protein